MSVSYYTNFLEESLYEECLLYATHKLNDNAFSFTNHTKWDKNILLDSALVNIHVLPFHHPLMERLTKAIQDKIQLTPKNSSIMFYYWMAGSHIPWHNDLGFKGGLTIYLNPTWDKNQGGLFLYEDEKDIKAIVPSSNNAVFQKGGIMHAVSATTLFSNVRMTIQVFF
jgi:hypothetical protein